MFDNYPQIPYIGYKDENVRTPITFPAQHQNFQPGFEYVMNPLPIFDNPNYVPSQKLKDRVAIISHGAAISNIKSEISGDKYEDIDYCILKYYNNNYEIVEYGNYE